MTEQTPRTPDLWVTTTGPAQPPTQPADFPRSPQPSGEAATPSQSQRRVRGRRAGLAALALSAALLGSAGVGGATALAWDDAASAGTVTRNAAAGSAGTTDGTTANAAYSGAPLTVESAAARALASAVTIEVAGASTRRFGYSADPSQGQQSSGTGTGIVLSEDGYVLTNNHVVSGAANGGRITVTLADGRTAPAEVTGQDASSDLAVIRLQDVSGLTAAEFADDVDIAIGETVVAVGAPLGLSGTVTQGIVSAVNRPVRTGDSTEQSAVIDAVQTDAAINPGNSGGPLVDLQGRVVGVNSAIATVGSSSASDTSGNIGVGFAISADDAQEVAEQLIADGTAEHASLGVTAGETESDTSSGTQSDTQEGSGATLQQVTSGGAAAEAGLRTGDVVTAVDDRRVTDVDSLVAAVRDHAPGDSVEVTYVRDGSTATAQATLGSRSSS